MQIIQQIENYIASLHAPKQQEMQVLHNLVLQIMPKSKLWYLDGKDEKGKIVSNPNIGYGTYTINYTNGSTKDFYRVGLSANTTGISVYLMGIEDKTYLAKTFGDKIGKANVSGYCIKFKTIKDINIEVLEAAILFALIYSL